MWPACWPGWAGGLPSNPLGRFAGPLLGWLEGGLRDGATLAAPALTRHGDMAVTTKDELLTLVERSENLTR